MTTLRWGLVGLAILVASILLLFAGLPTRYPDVDPKQEAMFQERLRSYRQEFPAGLTRKQVSDSLRARNVVFFESCCDEHRMSSHMIKIGAQAAPWFCSDWTVYVAFHYLTAEVPGDPKEPLGSELDPLENIDLVSRGEGCL